MIRSAFFALALLGSLAAATPDPTSYFRYRRSVATPSGGGESCVVLDGATLSHAAPFLKDLRLVADSPSGPREIPYVLTVSEPQQAESEVARILNLRAHGRTLDFDLAMPARPYTEVDLDLGGQNFLLAASVTGAITPGASSGTPLGSFTLFDLTSQHLSHSGSLHLQESTFPFLHITLTASPARRGSLAPTPQMIRGAVVPPSREAQTLFTVAAETSTLDQIGHRSVARFDLGEKIPIERVSFRLDPSFHANFSRDVLVTAHASTLAPNSGDSVNGSIRRVHLTEAGRELSEEQLSLAAVLGANLQQPALVEVALNNGDAPPLPIAAVQLEMRRRDLCFEAPPSQQLTLFYGDSELPAPLYDFARTYTPSAHAIPARLGAEERNRSWRLRPDLRPYSDRHPQLLAVAMLLALCTLALVALRSSHPRRHHPHR